MDQPNYSKVFGLSSAAALGLMLALSALAQSIPSQLDYPHDPIARPLRAG